MNLAFEVPPTPTLRLKPSQHLLAKVDGEDAVLVGTSPDGWAAVLSPRQFGIFNERDYGLLHFTYGDIVKVYHVPAVELLSGLKPRTGSIIRYRNGLSLDIRPSNTVVVASAEPTAASPYSHRT